MEFAAPTLRFNFQGWAGWGELDRNLASLHASFIKPSGVIALKHLTTLAAVAALIGMPMAQAHASSASVHVSKLTFTALDLLPDDGLAPSFEFLAGAHVNTEILITHNETHQIKKAEGLLADLSSSHWSPNSQAQVTMGPDSIDIT